MLVYTPLGDQYVYNQLYDITRNGTNILLVGKCIVFISKGLKLVNEKGGNVDFRGYGNTFNSYYITPGVYNIEHESNFLNQNAHLQPKDLT